uniref:Cytosolic large ribosomal subunit L41 n=1 Tax=Ochlerotatus taeniorhynchus TaxID=329105 RepID=B8XVN8_OCHTA|nr:cytosolic large ribosomal subunit L41 [Ochlerotatus taeniorhynchus]
MNTKLSPSLSSWRMARGIDRCRRNWSPLPMVASPHRKAGSHRLDSVLAYQYSGNKPTPDCRSSSSVMRLMLTGR